MKKKYSLGYPILFRVFSVTGRQADERFVFMERISNFTSLQYFINRVKGITMHMHRSDIGVNLEAVFCISF